MPNPSLYNDYDKTYIVMEQTTPENSKIEIQKVVDTNGLNYVRFSACLQDFNGYNRNRRKWPADIVRQMAEGCLELYGTDYCICSTGYTGGGSERVASGTIWLAYGRKDDIHTHCLHLDASREDNTAMAALTAVKLLAAIL